MNNLLHLDSSLRTEGSHSRKLSAHFAERWLARHPAGTITYCDLALDPVPHLDNTAPLRREPWLRHALSTLGVDNPVFIDTELTLARESPAMSALDLGGLEDKSIADALTAIETLVA